MGPLMRQDWLTVRLVEELQERIEDGQEIGSIVSGLHGATLPGLVEYRCLQRATSRSIPTLPPAVTSSTIGKAFHSLRQSLDHQRSGAAPSALRRIDAQPAEFYLIGTVVELGSDDWKTFTIRFARSA